MDTKKLSNYCLITTTDLNAKGIHGRTPFTIIVFGHFCIFFGPNKMVFESLQWNSELSKYLKVEPVSFVTKRSFMDVEVKTK